jgi:dihydrolipoamide dehydrogenase
MLQQGKPVEERKVDVAIIGAGSAGLYALSEVKRAGKSFVLIDGGELGTTCARVGCMPSKAIIQVAEDFHRPAVFHRFGITGHENLQIDLGETMEYVQETRDHFVDLVLSNSIDQMPPDKVIESNCRFIEPTLLETEDGQRVRADAVIIASGSTPIVPAAWDRFRDRIITTDEFFELEDLPKSVAVIGLGVIGLEIGQSLKRLGVEVTGIDQLETIGGITDPKVAHSAIEAIGKEFPVWLGHPAEISEEPDGRLRVTAGEHSVVVDKVFASLGRRPNLDSLNLGVLGVARNDKGIPAHNPNTMQVGDLPVFIAGDVSGNRPILHEAGDEGRIAGYNASHEGVAAFQRRVPFAVTFSDPNIVRVGASFAELDPETTAVGAMRVSPVGRALIMAKNRGLIHVYADKASGKLLGCEMVAPKGENLGHLLVLAIGQGMTVGQLLQLPFYHPTMEEALQAALRDLYRQVDTKNPGPLTELNTL